MKKISKNIADFLSENYFWNGEIIIEKDKLKRIFETNNYYPSEKLLSFLIYLYNYKFKFDYKKIDVDFRIKKVLKDYPYKYFNNQLLNLLKVKQITPFGEFDNGHLVLISDELDNIYAVMDDYVIKLGNDYNEMLENLYTNGLNDGFIY